jgi:hypothetical protein
MTDAAIIAGSLVDAKNVNTHKVMRLIIDVPAENALKVIAAFGWPTMVDPVPVAVARLNIDGGNKHGILDSDHGTLDSDGRDGDSGRVHPELRPSSVTDKPKKSPAQIAGYLCTTIPFQKFLKEKFSDVWHQQIADVAEDGADDWGAESAARSVRLICKVGSRRQITADNVDWSALLLAFRLWETHPELEDA